MSYKINRKIQNEYLVMHIFAKILNINNYDPNGILKPEKALTNVEILAMQELGLDSTQGVLDYVSSLNKSNIVALQRKPRG